MRGRYANLAELSEEDRENKLEVKTVEYLVHGISEKGMGEGKNGLPGAFWLSRLAKSQKQRLTIPCNPQNCF